VRLWVAIKNQIKVDPLSVSFQSFARIKRCTILRTPMAHSIVTNTCEGVADCVSACPVACIHEGAGKNSIGTDWYWIDFNTCIDCGICLQVCPVEGAILPEERPDLQAQNS
jgi:NAD-dependent dihydropyrimidine dehydrogenase PreA subunit